jgi:hypothetical protein
MAGMDTFIAACAVVWPGEVKTAHGIIGRAIEAAKTPAVSKILKAWHVKVVAAQDDADLVELGQKSEEFSDAIAVALVTCLRALKACKKAKAAPKVEDGPEEGPSDSDGPEEGPEDAPEDIHPLERGDRLAQALAGPANALYAELQSGAAELSETTRVALMSCLATLSKVIKAA